MANLTVVIDDDLLHAARLRALQHGTSVNEICREAIARFARAGEDVEQRLAALLAAAAGVRESGNRSAAGTNDRAAPAWSSRESLYAERLGLADARPAGKSPRRR